MKQEKKDLLFKDLCKRSSYGVICQFIWTYSNETTNGEDAIAKEVDKIRCIDIHTKEIQADYYREWVNLEHCKPYLRPLSSMTMAEKEKFRYGFGSDLYGNIKRIDWLITNHFDYQNLIPMKLALKAKKEMYKTKEE